MYKELIKSEIQLTDDECCIVFDFGCYFPYANPEILTFDFSLGMEKFEDYKINHRYPNKGYQTISKKYGRKISKLGYPYIMKLNEQSSMPILLNISVGINDQCVTAVFPIQTSMTKDKPVCGLSLRYDFDKGSFYFESREKIENGPGWWSHRWSNYELEGSWNNFDILLNPPQRVSDDGYILVYEDVITPYPSALSNLLL